MKLSNRSCLNCEHAKMSGKYLPATQYDPEEFPEFDECICKDEQGNELNPECNEHLAQVCEYFEEYQEECHGN